MHTGSTHDDILLQRLIYCIYYTFYLEHSIQNVYTNFRVCALAPRRSCLIRASFLSTCNAVNNNNSGIGLLSLLVFIHSFIHSNIRIYLEYIGLLVLRKRERRREREDKDELMSLKSILSLWWSLKHFFGRLFAHLSDYHHYDHYYGDFFSSILQQRATSSFRYCKGVPKFEEPQSNEMLRNSSNNNDSGWQHFAHYKIFTIYYMTKWDDSHLKWMWLPVAENWKEEVIITMAEVNDVCMSQWHPRLTTFLLDEWNWMGRIPVCMLSILPHFSLRLVTK